MRIAQLIDSLTLGGAERLQVTFAETALARGIKPTVISLARAPGSPVVEWLRQLDVPVVEFAGRNLVDPFRFIRLTHYLLRERFDVIHAHLEYAIIVGACAGSVTGIPVVATVHSIFPSRWKRLEPFMLRLGVCHVIAVGDAVAEAYRGKLKGKPLDVLVNPVKSVASVSSDERKLIRAELTGDSERPLLIAVGRVEIEKGFSDLVLAMQIVHKSHPGALLVIAGDGSLKEQLQTQIDSFGSGDFIRLLGLRNDVPRLLSASDIFVSASHWEGMPVAVLEAMSAGLAVVATNVGDLPCILDAGRGILVPPHQPQVMAEALKSLLDNPSCWESLGGQARSYVISQHNADIWLDKLLKIYESVL